MTGCRGFGASMNRLIIGTVIFLCASLDIPLTKAFTPPPEIRRDTSLIDGWRFIKSDLAGAEQESFDDQSWDVISVPHTWNAEDGQDGGNNYYRGPGFYRRHFFIDAHEVGRQLFIHFDGV